MRNPTIFLRSVATSEINTISCGHSGEQRFSPETNLHQAQKPLPGCEEMVGAYFTLSLGGHIVADTLMKPIELAVPAGEVGQGPAKQTNQTVQRKIVGPLSPLAIWRISIAKPKLTAKPDIDTELAEIRRAWRPYQSHNSRDAVYTYLSKVFRSGNPMATSRLCTQERSSCSSPTDRRTTNEARAFRHRDLLHRRSRGC